MIAVAAASYLTVSLTMSLSVNKGCNGRASGSLSQRPADGTALKHTQQQQQRVVSQAFRHLGGCGAKCISKYQDWQLG